MASNELHIPSPTGTTRLFAVIGYPVAQVRAPEVMNRYFLEHGCDAVLIPIEVRPDDLAVVLDGLKRIQNLDGIIVTIPHKFAVCRHVDRLSDSVALGGSANVLRRDDDGRWQADNFDGAGFVRGLQNAGHAVEAKIVSLYGCGGAGAAIAVAMLKAGVGRLAVFDIVPERQSELIERLHARWPGRIVDGSPVPAPQCDIVVNATALGMRADDPFPFDIAGLPPTTVVAEVIMKPPETQLLTIAAARGLRIHHGVHMLTGQIDLWSRFFRF